MKFWKKASLALGLGLALQGVAQAGPLVEIWDYVFDSNWSDAAPAADVTISGDLHTLSWGIPVGGTQSTLQIVVPTLATQVTTNGAAADGSLLEHNNQVITGNALSSAVLGSSIMFSPFFPTPGGALPTFMIDSKILFTETLNAPPCAVSASAVPCDDIFVLQEIAPQTVSFNFDGNSYAVDIFPSLTLGVTALEPSACIAAGIASGVCVGFSTEEGKTTPMQLAFSVTGTKIPEPGSLALLGLGLVGLVAARRRQQR